MVSDRTSRRMQVVFSGRVQGVGFRYTACRVAESFKVTGYVRNLPEGDVEIVAEGAEQELLDFLNAIRGGLLGRCIVGEDIRWNPATGQYERFGITYS